MKNFPLLLLVAASLPATAQTITSIGALQGRGAAATAGPATVEAVVTAVYPGLSPAGFFVQNTAAEADGDPATSDALFVVQAAPAVAVGDRLRISGTVQEGPGSPSFNQAVLTAPVITVLGSGQALPAAALLPVPGFGTAAAEAYEGMVVRFGGPLTVADVAAVRSRGELTLSTDGLVFQPTQVVDPNDAPASGTSSTGGANVPAVLAYQAANAAKSFILDDGRAATNPSPTPYLEPALGTVRVGSTVASLRAILSQNNTRWRLQPLPGPDAPLVRTQRPAVPAFARRPDVRVASFNVLNYFNGDGQGNGFPTARGAATLADFQRQRAKIILALSQLDADAVALMELENDGSYPASAAQDLLAGLNATAAGPYALVDDGPFRQPGNSDLIRCAIIYRPAALRPLGPPLLSISVGFERPPLAQVFVTPTAVPDTFALIANHFKSKASGTGVNADQGDGQGASNPRRRQQAQELGQFIQGPVRAAGARRVVSVGDYNANYEEDPLDVLRAAGLLIPSPATATSYVFSGQSGALDHAVFSPSLAGRAEVHKWNINSAEPEFLEYDLAGPATDTGSPFRSSDHDPILIGLYLAGAPLAAAPGRPAAAPAQLHVFPNPSSGAFGFRLAGPPPAGPLTLELYNELGQRLLREEGPLAALQAALLQRSAALAAGRYLLRLRGAGFGATQRVSKE